MGWNLDLGSGCDDPFAEDPGSEIEMPFTPLIEASLNDEPIPFPRADGVATDILRNSKVVAKALMHSYNSRRSTFMHPCPKKSLGTFRFKFTRQWVRVDTTQHTVCFFVRLLRALISEKVESP